MDSRQCSNIPSKTALTLKLLFIFSVVYASTELLEAYVESYFSTSILFNEVLEHVTLVGVLLLFMSKFVTNPMLREIVSRKQTEQYLQQSELNNRNIIESMPDTVIRVTADGTVVDYKPKQNCTLCFKIGANISDPLPAETVLSFLNCMNEALQKSVNQQIDLKFGQDLDVCYLTFNFIKSATDEVTIFMRDITSRKVYEEQLKYLSSHDALTGLYNRTFYETEIDRLANSRRYPIGILISDLDGLKATNDTYGHEVGDRMICKASNILKSSFRADDLLARTGGDEFTVLLPEAGNDTLLAAVERIEFNLNEANKTGDSFCVKLSLGTAIAESKEKLLSAVKVADMNMYKNKADRKLNCTTA